ncbi:interleukin-18-like isoform X2 [Pseudonaja textilis]|uniref:interleukin-18-like isoform X2 n=1 Tax=Pseudonaja textilis TaxID=8673 RepID=UPI000EA936EB|nr:interleukin-18-like isoform X2 [Pseudonaja textilis]
MGSDMIQMLPVILDQGGNLYFQEQVLETDSWRMSGKCEPAQVFRSPNNHILIARPIDEDFPAVFERRTDQEIRNVSGIRFDIHSYQDTKPKGLCVAFTVEFNNQIYHMCVEKKESKMRVNFKEGTIPKNIEGDTSNIIFIKTRFSGGSRQFYKFESALERGYFLAFESVKGSSETVLVVKKVEPADEVDESTKLHHATLL